MRLNALLLSIAAAQVANVLQAVAASPVDAVHRAEEKRRATRIREAFSAAWEGYYAYAFPHDELKPVTRSFEDMYNGWGLTVVDALSTASIMGLESIVDRSLAFISTIDYTRDATNTPCSLFETTIRHLGGLLSAHDLLTGPLAHLAEKADVHRDKREWKMKMRKKKKNKTRTSVLLKQARTLADALKFAFDTPSGIPLPSLYVNNHTASEHGDSNVAQAGTLVLEWTRLSDVTGVGEYGTLARRAEHWLLQPHRGGDGDEVIRAEPYPGLVGSRIDVGTGRFTTDAGGWVGGEDSFYEYLIKMYVYDPVRFGWYKDRWIAAADSSIKHLQSHPSTRPDLTFLAQHRGTHAVGSSQHLACFSGGNFILGGLVLRQRRFVDFGLRLVDGCEAVYNQTLTGLGPDVFSWDLADSKESTVPAEQSDFYQRAGFYPGGSGSGGGSGHALRPEAIESFYYAYRATGDRKYQNYIWRAFESLQRVAGVRGTGFSVVRDVNAPRGGGLADYQPSYFLAETLKYAYLAHAPHASAHVGTGWGPAVQEWVFNTEAHPMRVVR